jgi:uncharacterized protein DUF5681
MAAKKAAKRRTQNSAKAVRGRPFQKGHAHAFKPGQSGNPGGRPKTKQFSEAARKWFAADYGRAPHLSNAEALVEFLGKEAFGGGVAAARALIEYAEGKPKQTVAVEADDRLKAVIESGIQALVQTGLSDEEARAYLAEYVPEVKRWTN